ncbi:MAG: ribosome-associated translation inhibitor RaiA [Caldilinea sp.]|nr:ribosome-associated translation inhibitor RaiA [Caldilinea sp.]MCB0134604.1 ribosome-associated translation inhibitor RaiA [Caldilineaceae bacterium]MCB0038307.1 ribosome-associated translation inhibitor RaiA [Caldilinea sp.]MCB0050374.1 ribosome-associated translation inhibitor RaiA [Caldilinea sp.]MCB0150944.1 ribosome-associated translation inhibitor RaiA [Caldilineaceae bacterium]
MKVMVNGRNIEVTDYLREYVTKKVGRLERYLPQIGEVRADLTQNPTRSADDRYTAQITIWANGQILRAEEATSDIFASVDATIDKISSQIRRFKGRRHDSKRRASHAATREAEIAVTAVAEEVEMEEEPGYIIKRKQFLVEPMDEEEALEQMELLGHDFFVFYNPQASSINVIYRRRDGNYGLLIPAVS